MTLKPTFSGFIAAFLHVACWLALFLAGVFAYISLRALWFTIALGTPMYDWQWYVPFTLLLVVLPLHFVCGWCYIRYMMLIYGGLLLWLLVGFNGLGYVEHLPLQNSPPVAISFWVGGFRQPSVSLLEDLREAQATVYMRVPIPLEGDKSINFSALLHQLESYHIPVVLFVPASDFLSAPVYREWIVNARQAAAFVEDENITNVRGLIADAEAPRFTPFDSFRSDIPAVTEATIGLGNFLDSFQQGDSALHIGVTAAWQLHLDKLDGDFDLAILYRSPVDPPGGWDFVSVMNYSSYYPQKWRSYMVRRVIQNMEYRYPGKPISHLIGLVGGGFPWEPLLDFEGIVQDARIGRALGVQEIVVFQLEGAMEVFGEEFVQRFNAAVNGPQAGKFVVVPFSRPASLWLYHWIALDATLDLFNSRVWLTISWAILSLGFVGLLKRKRHYQRH